MLRPLRYPVLAIAASAAPTTGSGGEQRLHLLEGVGLDLADTLGADAVLVGQFLQRDLVVGVEPTSADDVARAIVPGAPAVAQTLPLALLGVGALESLRWILFRRAQVT